MLEGEWPRDKVVIMEFPDHATAQEFQNSPEYQEISSMEGGRRRHRAHGEGPVLNGQAGTTSYPRELRVKQCPGLAGAL